MSVQTGRFVAQKFPVPLDERWAEQESARLSAAFSILYSLKVFFHYILKFRGDGWGYISAAF